MTAPAPHDAPRRSPLRHIRPSDLLAAALAAVLPLLDDPASHPEASSQRDAVLECAGHGADWLLASNPFTAPFAWLERIRSVGITDLRHGHVQGADWQEWDRFASGADHRQPLPLPDGVRCFAVAATLAGHCSRLAERLTGDGLVPLDGALGRCDHPARRLDVPSERQCIVYRTGHLELLSSPVVAEQLRTWLAGPDRPA